MSVNSQMLPQPLRLIALRLLHHQQVLTVRALHTEHRTPHTCNAADKQYEHMRGSVEIAALLHCHYLVTPNYEHMPSRTNTQL